MSSALIPGSPSSNVGSSTCTVVLFTVVVVPFTVKVPETTASPVIVTVDDVISSELSVPVTVKSLPIVTSLGRPIVILLLDTAVSISFEVPSKVNVSEPNATVSLLPLSAAIVKFVEILAVLTAVTKPLALTVTTGIAVVVPNDPTLLLTVANVPAPVTLPEPSNDAEVHVMSPVIPIVLPVASAVAVSALPVKSPVIAPEAFKVVKEPAAAVEPPITTPLIVPPVSVTFVMSCVAILPSPKPVLAPAAVVPPVPPLAIGKVPLTSVVKDIAEPALNVPPETLIIPELLLKSCPVPPY